MSVDKEQVRRDALTHALHEHGWHDLSPEQQDDLIASGWHPGPHGGCSRRIKTGFCGTNGLCPRCWSIQKAEDAYVALSTALTKIESGRITNHDIEWAGQVRSALSMTRPA